MRLNFASDRICIAKQFNRPCHVLDSFHTSFIQIILHRRTTADWPPSADRVALIVEKNENENVQIRAAGHAREYEEP